VKKNHNEQGSFDQVNKSPDQAPLTPFSFCRSLGPGEYEKIEIGALQDPQHFAEVFGDDLEKREIATNLLCPKLSACFELHTKETALAKYGYASDNEPDNVKEDTKYLWYKERDIPVSLQEGCGILNAAHMLNFRCNTWLDTVIVDWDVEILLKRLDYSPKQDDPLIFYSSQYEAISYPTNESQKRNKIKIVIMYIDNHFLLALILPPMKNTTKARIIMFDPEGINDKISQKYRDHLVKRLDGEHC